MEQYQSAHGATHMDAFHNTIELSGVNIQADATLVRAAVLRSEVLKMKIANLPEDLRTYYDALAEAVGEVANIAEDYMNAGAPTGERWSDICFDPSVPTNTAFRYGKNGQPLHTDESYVSNMAGVMLFYCQAAAPRGGETLYVSGRELVDYLASEKPELLKRLQAIPVTYSKANDCKTCPIVQVADNGAVTMNYNYYCADTSNSDEALQLNQEFHDFLENDLPDQLIFKVALKPGEAAAWHDSKTLHGRYSFDAENFGDRWIWKTGIVLDSLVA